jgi:hypothetical protein
VYYYYTLEFNVSQNLFFSCYLALRLGDINLSAKIDEMDMLNSSIITLQEFTSKARNGAVAEALANTE